MFQEMTGPAIEAAWLGSGLWVEGSGWTTQKGIASPKLFYDADTTRKVVCKSNLLKN